jgi:hypothetical protein
MASVGLINGIVFFILIAVVVLCAVNLSTYSDILQGNKLAPDISDGECITMIVINVLLILGAVFGGYFFIKKVYAAAVDKFFTTVDGVLVPKYDVESEIPGGIEYKKLYGKYVPNNSGTQIVLWLVSTFIFVASILNLMNLTKLKNGDDANAVVPSTGVYIISWALFGIAGLYWVYTTLRTLMPRIPNYKIDFIEFFKAAAEKPVVPIVPCDCTKGGLINNIKDFKVLCKKDIKMISKNDNDIISTYPQTKRI